MYKTGKTGTLSKSRPTRIYLTGFMGAGKSTVGPILAKSLGWAFQDTDQWIEKSTGTSPTQWIANAGESEFRRVEFWAIQEISRTPEVVVALGGGAMVSPDVREWLQVQGQVIYLKADLNSIVDRLSENLGDRPLIQTLGGHLDHSILRSLFEKRLNHYEKADFSVDTDLKSPNQIAEELNHWVLREFGQ